MEVTPCLLPNFMTCAMQHDVSQHVTLHIARKRHAQIVVPPKVCGKLQSDLLVYHMSYEVQLKLHKQPALFFCYVPSSPETNHSLCLFSAT